MDEENQDVCQRCARAGRPCVFTPLQKRKQRKRTDTRVAELEREMRAMRSMLKNKESSKSGSTNKEAAVQRPAGLWFAENALEAPATEEAGVHEASSASGGDSVFPQKQPFGSYTRPGRSELSRQGARSRDVVDSGIISMATARQLFETYRNNLSPHYPMVPVSDSVSADQMRQTKPTLFLAMITSAAGKEDGELSAILDTEILHTYADKSLVQSEKSLELVQALLISAMWYHPPNKFGQLKYYEYIHMAATMAMDIGICTRQVPHQSRFGNSSSNREGRTLPVHPLEDANNPDLSMTPRSRGSSPDTASLESRRTFIAVYSVCTAVAMSLRRPNMLRVNSYIRECLDYLEHSPNAFSSDRILVAWVRLTMIVEEIGISFSYDDPGGIASISELRTQLMLKDYAKRMDDWWVNVQETDMIPSMNMTYWTIRLYCHEIALHVDHSPEDFKAPFQMGKVHSWDGDEIPTQILAEAIAECITCSHNLLNTFLSMDVESARALPVFSYVRVSYAAFVLAKLCLSAAHPGSRIGQVLDRGSLKVESYMDRCILHVRTIVGPGRCRVPAIFLALLFKLRQWCLHPEIVDRSEKGSHQDPINLEANAAPQQGLPPRACTLQLEGPRLVEQDSSDDNTPPGHSLAGYKSLSNADIEAAASSGIHPLTPQSQPLDYEGIDVTVPSTETQATEVGSSTSTVFSQPVQAPFLNPIDQMDLDQNFFQFFGDMSNFPDSGVTGLDDWGSFPTDFLGLPGDMSYQNTSAPSNTTM